MSSCDRVRSPASSPVQSYNARARVAATLLFSFRGTRAAVARVVAGTVAGAVAVAPAAAAAAALLLLHSSAAALAIGLVQPSIAALKRALPLRACTVGDASGDGAPLPLEYCGGVPPLGVLPPLGLPDNEPCKEPCKELPPERARSRPRRSPDLRAAARTAVWRAAAATAPGASPTVFAFRPPFPRRAAPANAPGFFIAIDCARRADFGSGGGAAGSSSGRGEPSTSMVRTMVQNISMTYIARGRAEAGS